MTPAVGIVVAGGKSTRLGGADKAGLRLGGRTFLDRVIDAVATCVDRIVVVAAEGQEIDVTSTASPVPIRIVRDSAAGQGPLAAVADGLRAMRPGDAEIAVVVSCDVPKLVPAVLRLLIDAIMKAGDACDWVVPHVDGHPQVLVSTMRTTMLPAIEGHLAEGRRDVRGLLEKVRVLPVDEQRFRQVDPTLSSFRDVDTPEDLRRLS